MALQHGTDGAYYYSKLSVASECARKYKFQFIDKIAVPGAKSADIEFGQAMHLGLDAYLNGENGSLTFKVYWDSMRDSPMQYTRFKWHELYSIGMKLLSRFEARHLPHLKVAHNEQRLHGKIGQYAFEGTPDFIGTYKGVPTILDFKTSKDAYPVDKILVEEQLYGYAHLAKQILGFDATQIGYMVFCKTEARIQTSSKIDLTQHKLDDMISNIEIQIKELEARKEYPANRKSCLKGAFKCAYWNHCYGGESGTGSNQK